MMLKLRLKISTIIIWEEKNPSNIASTCKEDSKRIIRKVYVVSNLYEVKTLVIRENPSTQKSIAKSLNTSVAVINKIINQDLQVKMAKKKHDVHQGMWLNAGYFAETCMKTI